VRNVLLAPRDRGLDAVERHSELRRLPDALAGQLERTTDDAPAGRYIHGAILVLSPNPCAIPRSGARAAETAPSRINFGPARHRPMLGVRMGVFD
jgi:hypothetical protein